MADFLHGIEHVNVASDVVPVNDIVTAVIGLVGTADKGDTNVLTLCKSAADDAAFGTQGTIPEALKAIRMHGTDRQAVQPPAGVRRASISVGEGMRVSDMELLP